MLARLAPLLLVLVLAVPARGMETVLADPKPSIDEPRQIVFSLAENDPARINAVLSNIGNVQKFYGIDNVKMALVAYGPGLAAVLKDDNPLRARIEGLMAIEVEIIACGATMESMHKSEADLIKGVEVVPNGLPEIVERQLRGWVHLRP
jgi:intracellular sulfur oxidation DsrE/DsrF family protein